MNKIFIIFKYLLPQYTILFWELDTRSREDSDIKTYHSLRYATEYVEEIYIETYISTYISMIDKITFLVNQLGKKKILVFDRTKLATIQKRLPNKCNTLANLQIY